MIPTEQQAALLDQTAWVRGLTYSQVRAVAGYMSSRSARAGEVLVAEGAPEAFLAVLVEGRAVVCKRDGDGVEKLIASLSEGHCFGEISLLDGEPRSATVRATTPARILCLSAEDLERLVREKPKLAVEVYRRLGRLATQHLRSTSGRLVDVLATGPA